MQYDFYSWRSLPFSFMNWVTCVKPPPGFEPVHPDCEADDVPTELSHPLQYTVCSDESFERNGRMPLTDLRVLVHL